MKSIRYPLLFLALLAQFGWAASTDELAQKLGDLKKSVQAQDGRLSRIESQLQNQGLLNLLNQVEALKAEVARLRGSQEELAYQQTTADKRVKELFADLDDRVKELESRPAAAAQAPAVLLQPAQAMSTSVSAATGAAPAEDLKSETRAYEAAHQLMKSGHYKDAVLAFQSFAKTYPNSNLVPNAHYWTGFSYMGMSDFESAAASYRHLIGEYPNSPKTPDAMLSLARTLVQMKDLASATTTLEELIERFPYSRAADNGKKLLATLK